jgi:hypothetical protein
VLQYFSPFSEELNTPIKKNLLLLLYRWHVYTCEGRSDRERGVVAQIDGSEAQLSLISMQQAVAAVPVRT